MQYSLAAILSLTMGAAVLHATWNVVLKASQDPLNLATRASAASAVVITPVVLVAWLLSGRPGLPPEAWILAAASGVAELLYFVFLSRAYREGELSVVYPIARGTAPLLSIPAGLILLGERLNMVETIGVGCLLIGIWMVRKPALATSATIPAVLTGVAIATYTTIDRVGVRMGTPWLYGWALWVFAALFLVALELIKRRLVPAPDHPAREDGDVTSWAVSAGVGTLMLGAYLLILFALNIAPLAVVAPLRESAIVLVTGWGIWHLRERQGAWLRVGGALGIVVGAVLLAVR